MGRKPSYTPAQEARVLKLSEAGLTGEAIAAQTKVSRRTVDRIVCAA